MRDNPVKAKVSSGGRAVGAMVFEFFSPGIPQLCCNAGAEFVLYDMEHTGLDFETLKTQVALCRGLPIVPMVRVPRGEYHFIARALDVGARGVMVPMVGTADEAARIVVCTRYPPAGRRGAAFGFAHDDYEGGEVAAKIAALHARTMVIPQIETPEGLDNVEAIAAVPGVDALWVGHFDLTNFMGIPGQFQHPDYLKGIDRIVAACEAHGKTAGFLATDDTWARDYAAKGFRLMGYGIDHAMLQRALAQGLDVLRDAMQFPGEQAMTKLRVGLTRDILDSRGEPAFGAAALAILDRAPGIEWEYLPDVVPEITPDHAARYDALYVNLPRVGASSVAREDCRLAVVARHGVGYDSVDIPAMTKAGVIVTHTPSSMPRPVATIALSFVLALAGKLFLKDRITRTGRWHERMDNMGMGLTGRTLGVVGAGRIGKELLRMSRTFDMKLLAADPYVNAIELGYIGARKVDLDTLLGEADFVVVCCLLNDGTRHLIGAPQFARMRRSAYFVNVARGPIVDEPALIDALGGGRIAGAALDVFEQEPVSRDNPLLAMDNVIVTPHSLCWTDECFHNMASTGLASIVDALAGRRPEFVVNPDVLGHPRVRARENS